MQKCIKLDIADNNEYRWSFGLARDYGTDNYSQQSKGQTIYRQTISYSITRYSDIDIFAIERRV